MAMALIERGADIDARDRYQMTPLHHACINGCSAEVAMALVERGANIDVRNKLSEYYFYESIHYLIHLPMIRFRLMSTFIRVFMVVKLPLTTQEQDGGQCQWTNCWPPASDMSQVLLLPPLLRPLRSNAPMQSQNHQIAEIS